LSCCPLRASAIARRPAWLRRTSGGLHGRHSSSRHERPRLWFNLPRGFCGSVFPRRSQRLRVSAFNHHPVDLLTRVAPLPVPRTFRVVFRSFAVLCVLCGLCGSTFLAISVAQSSPRCPSRLCVEAVCCTS
jgi:hypothetical protein